MPITHAGYAVHIESDGKELPQFDVEVLDERTVTCWMPSEAGKTFLMRYTTVGKHPHEYMCAQIHADGRKLAGHGGRDAGKSYLEYQTLYGVGTRPFVFSEVIPALDTTQGEGEEDAPASLSKDLGVIEIKFWSATKLQGDRWLARTKRDESVVESEGAKVAAMQTPPP